jgi:hypothetical protein
MARISSTRCAVAAPAERDKLLKFIQRGDQAGVVCAIARVHHAWIERGHRRAVQDTLTPTTIKSTLCRVRTLNISRNLGFELCTEGEQRVYLILEDGEALARRQGKHPADQREIDSVITVLRHHELSLLRASPGRLAGSTGGPAIRTDGHVQHMFICLGHVQDDPGEECT